MFKLKVCAFVCVCVLWLGYICVFVLGCRGDCMCIKYLSLNGTLAKHYSNGELIAHLSSQVRQT